MNEELLKKAKSAGSADEIRKLALSSGLELSEEGAADIYSRLNRKGELGDDELSSVSGGACRGNNDDGTPKHKIGETVSWNWSLDHCEKDGSSSGEIIDYRRATEGSAVGGFYVYPGAVLYTVKCSKCGTLMEIPEVWLN